MKVTSQKLGELVNILNAQLFLGLYHEVFTKTDQNVTQ